MYRLFGIPMPLFVDRATDFELVCQRQDRKAIQKIFSNESVEKRVAAVEALMLKRLSNRPDRHLDHIEYASRLILSHNGNLPVGRLAREVNMSKRNLERHFIGKVGVSPKSFSCIARIKNALELIMLQPALAWKDISQKLEYADPAHFFHEFKKFTKTTPNDFFQSITDFDQFLYAG
jgi:AraC-like DNA-binding protein